jgi:hypothetical protein
MCRGDEPYARGIVPERPFVAVRSMRGELVAVLGVRFPDRNLALEAFGSRAFPDGSVAELCVTDEPDAGPGKRVARAAYVGFVRFPHGGVVAVGMRCRVGDQEVGEVVGFDGVHAPNHWNIVVRSERFADGAERGLTLGTAVEFVYREGGSAA